MGGSTCGLSVKILLLCRLSLNFRPLSVVGKSQLIFLLLVGNFSLVLSLVSNIFSPFVVSRLRWSYTENIKFLTQKPVF